MTNTEHSPAIRRLVYAKKQEGDSYSKIARDLHLPLSTVKGIVRRIRASGSALSAPRSGRPRKTTKQLDRVLVRDVLANRRASARSIAVVVEEQYGAVLSPSTIRNRLHEAGLNGRSARKKPYLSKKHREQRRAYARKLLKLSESDWQKMMFSDEASVQLHGATGRVWVWRKVDEAFCDGTVKLSFPSSRQSLMIWGCMSRAGVGTLHICEERVNGEYYQRMLQQEVPFSKVWLGIKDVLWVQDNAPAHRHKKTKELLKTMGLNDLGHPPNSPDLNPIEGVWGEMKRRLAERPMSSISELKIRLKEIWYSLSDEYIARQVDSMPGRLETVLQQRGGYTKY